MYLNIEKDVKKTQGLSLIGNYLESLQNFCKNIEVKTKEVINDFQNRPKEEPTKLGFKKYLRTFSEYFIETNLRRACLWLIIWEAEQLKNKVCYLSNESIIKKLSQYGFTVSVETLRKDLKKLKANNLIRIEYDTLVQPNDLRLVNTLIDPSIERLLHIYNKYFLIERNRYTKGINDSKNIDLKKESRPENVHEVVNYFVEVLKKTASEAIRFYNHYSKRAWKIGWDTIYSWKGIAQKWISFKNNPDHIELEGV